ncbi:hypothetical protein [Pantoea sp. BAV 3049]|uniref:hypothetical protein n=1 Tax=Pantoea sp. BAV 3049 TaxID=2654188 RepID=UPI00131DD442|nr:hypothetical protein [Pantoea sp. BAV 3049]
MSVDSLRSAGYIHHPQPSENSFGSGFGTSDLSGKTNTSGQSGGGINYGAAQSGGSVLNFGNTLSQSHAAVGDAGSGSNTQNSGGELNQQILQVMSELLKMVMQLLQQNSGNSNNDSSSSSATSSGSSGNGSPAADVGAATASNVAQPQVNAGATIPAQSAPSTAIDSSGADDLSSSTTSPDPASDASAAPASGKSVGSGPRSFDITNNEDHDISLGMFDKDNNKVAEMKLKPGETGTMNYQNDFTGVIKQADADGKYQDSASRLEFYNGFVNTSDIDGRNASISATDHNGFNIGDNKSIADGAPSNIVSEDSAGDKTIAGWYDGSSDTMKAGGQYMEDQLGTGDTYIHPNDDRLGQGSNPMRHTDAMNIDVSFGKA